MLMAKEKPKKAESEDDEAIDAGWIGRTYRFPPELHEWIKQISKMHRRSRNLEVVWLLEYARKHLPESCQNTEGEPQED